MPLTRSRPLRGGARLLLALALLASADAAVADNGEYATTFYLAQISGNYRP